MWFVQTEKLSGLPQSSEASPAINYIQSTYSRYAEYNSHTSASPLSGLSTPLVSGILTTWLCQKGTEYGMAGVPTGGLWVWVSLGVVF